MFFGQRLTVAEIGQCEKQEQHVRRRIYRAAYRLEYTPLNAWKCYPCESGYQLVQVYRLHDTLVYIYPMQSCEDNGLCTRPAVYKKCPAHYCARAIQVYKIFHRRLLASRGFLYETIDGFPEPDR